MNEKLENVKSIQEYVEVQKQYVAVLTRRYQQINNIKKDSDGGQLPHD